MWSDLSVRISQRRFVCVADPCLCLSPPGAAFIGGLTRYAEIWLGAEFLSILDGAPLYERQPDLLGVCHKDDLSQALRHWSRLRDEAGRRLHWVRDGLRDSLLPAGLDEAVLPAWEVAAQGLDERLSATEAASGPMIAALRDTAALAGVLPGAIVLCARDASQPDKPPRLCQHLQQWGIACRHLGTEDDLVALERSLLLHLLVEAGVGGFLWAGLRLAVLHLVLPTPPYAQARHLPGDDADYLSLDGDVPCPMRGIWQDAQAFWYDLATEDPYAGR